MYPSLTAEGESWRDRARSRHPFLPNTSVLECQFLAEIVGTRSLLEPATCGVEGLRYFSPASSAPSSR